MDARCEIEVLTRIKSPDERLDEAAGVGTDDTCGDQGTDSSVLACGRGSALVQCGCFLPFQVRLCAYISNIQWDQGRIVKFGWSLDERLVVLNEEGVYRLYDLQGEYQQHSLGTEAAEMGIIDAKIYGNGLVALTSSLTLLEVKGWEGARPLTLANPGTSAYLVLDVH